MTTEVHHIYIDGTTAPEGKKAPAKIKARLEEILVEANRRKHAANA